ncbi:AraC family transcriptional regulator N-terminal domain-containing protein [Telmatobacter bradus]|uniref:AraC family transcriptional regulator n=1 Tax=Telmatobacter bradus TaxID=474953 RepID=UPI003B42F3F0
MSFEDLRSSLAQRIADLNAEEGVQATTIPGLNLYRRSEPTECNSAAYDPKLIVFVQGEKRINLGGTPHVCTAHDFLISALDLPVVSQVTRASKAHPLLNMMIDLEMPTLREIISREEFPELSDSGTVTRGMTVGQATPELLSACHRLLDLLETPDDIPFLSGLIQREIFYRILRGPEGRHLRAIVTLGEQSNRTARAVAWLRENFSKPLKVEELASIAQMGVSTLHHHFRSLTSMSPLQYQKQLRLHTARVRMLMEGLDAATAAYEVGYESPSQFSREYSRFFGMPPVRDIKNQRSTGVAAQE